ncbi:MAG: DUF2207 domain-containing protein [Gemmatimonadales bacterium]|nr:MAG: DUF2207 domain-containing protein [Gemmatimonadales bacterium]
MRRFLPWGLLCCSFLLSGGLAATPSTVGGQTRSLEVERFHSTLTVASSGVLHVRETVTFRFQGSWNGIYRSIPVSYETPMGFGYKLRLEVESVALDDGTALRTEESKEGGYLKIKAWVPGASDVTKTVVIEYRVPNALRFFETHDELYWNVTGLDWEVPLGYATAEVILPEGVTGLRASAFTGSYGSTAGEADVTPTPVGVDFATWEPLGFRRGLTVVVGWDPGPVARPTALDRGFEFFRANVLLLLPFLSLFLMWKRWQRFGKDPDTRPVFPRYEPPEGLSPGEAGTLLDNTPDIRDITATLVDLAIRGYLRIEEEKPGLVERLLGDRDFTFVQIRGPADWEGLLPHERRVLEGVFDEGTRVTSDDLKNEFYRELPGIKDALFESLVGHGFYKVRPDRVVGRWIAFGIVLSVTGAIGLTALGSRLYIPPVTTILSGVLLGVPVVVFGALMGSRTRAGVRKLEEILGFEDFLSRVEKDRFRRMIQSVDQFEAILPHAMALGVEKKWGEAFDDLYTEPPEWYVGRYEGSFRPSRLTAHLADFTRVTGAAMTAAPRSSSGSSGFSGGGFSGGGFGGGGGGGF